MTGPDKLRIGVFGGSFNPPHLAHLALARSALAALKLDELRWLPAGQPWQKPSVSLAAAEHRLAMLRLLLNGEPGHVIDPRELHRVGPSYSIDSLRELKAEQPRAELFLIIGQDQYARLNTWKDWRGLLALCTLAVAARDGQAVRASTELAAVPHAIERLPMPAMPHSASAVRAALAAGQADVSTLVGPALAGYIAEHQLYPRSKPA